MVLKVTRVPSSGHCTFYCSNNTQSNKRPNGRVNTDVQSYHVYAKAWLSRDNPGMRYPSNIQFKASSEDAFYTPTRSFPDEARIKARLLAEARARFDGRLRSGHADLGVTIGSWKQSWDMIAKRANQARRSLDKAHRRLSERLNNSERLRQHRRISKRERDLKRWRGSNNYLETPANLILEGDFGWLPLLQDAAKALGVMTKPLPNGWVSGSATTAFYNHTDAGTNPRTILTVSGRARCTIAANVRVDNPNLWLANQLGLLNAPGVALDLIPWSFVVGMFANLQQIASSFTAHLGLSIVNTSTTYSHNLLREVTTDYTKIDKGGAPAYVNIVCRERNRDVGPIPAVPLVVRMPELSVETAILAVSLAVQQVSRITKLLS